MDERDEDLLKAMRVTPVSQNMYMASRMLLMILFSLILVLLFPTLTGLVEVPFMEYLPIAILFSLFTPIAALTVLSKGCSPSLTSRGALLPWPQEG